MFQSLPLLRKFHRSAVPSSGSSQLNEYFAVSPPLVSEILSALPSFLSQKINPFALILTLKASKRTQNATAEVVKDNGIIVGLNPQAGSPEGWHLRDNGRLLEHGCHEIGMPIY